MKIDFHLSEVGLTPSDFRDPSRYEGILYSDFFGSFALRSNSSGSWSIDHCPLLWTARALHGLLTFPILYDREASELLPDIDVRLVAVADQRETHLSVLDSKELVFEARADSLALMREFERAYSGLLADTFRIAPNTRNEKLFLQRIPDAFALAFPDR
jgi:hypothetical protein